MVPAQKRSEKSVYKKFTLKSPDPLTKSSGSVIIYKHSYSKDSRHKGKPCRGKELQGYNDFVHLFRLWMEGVFFLDYAL